MSVLHFIKDKMNTGKPIDADAIFKQIRNYDIVSFDIFDTLLKRNIHNPTDVFRYMESSLGVQGFTDERILAEKNARKKTSDEEISLEDIYKELKINLLQEELYAESSLLIANDEMVSVFKRCTEEKEVILISDMYLPENFIVSVLKREGIVGYKRLYLSSTLNKTKSSGELFEYAVSDLSISKEKLIHIGDSRKSDYQVPRSLGIAAIHIPTNTPKSSFHVYEEHIEDNILNTFLDNTVSSITDDYYRFGYEKFGMFLWGYSKWLFSLLEKEEIKDVYFFSRDGLIMKKAFDEMYSGSKITPHYLEVSRRSLRVPVLWMNHELEHVVDMISPSKLVSLRTIFDGVGLNIKDYKSLCIKYGFTIDSSFDRSVLLNDEKISKLYKELSADIEKVSRTEYEILVKYIKQNSLKGKFAIVDIGWSGGMQRYLDETLMKLGIDHHIKGYYIGVADYYKRNMAVLPSLDLNGYLFDFAHDVKAADKRSSFVGLFETLFLEQDGSVQNYQVIDGNVKANRLPYEYMENGEPTYEYECVQEIQKGAIDFIKRFSRYSFNYSAEKLFFGIEETGLRPRKKDITLFGDFRFFDEGETQCLAKPRGVFFYVLHLKAFKRDFLLSRWKIGFMKRMLKLDLPYEKMYRYMLKFK